MNRDMLELDLGRAILSSYDGAFLLAQFDSEGDEGTAPAEVLSPFGLDGRPRDPTPNSDGTPGVGATAMCASDGRQQHMFVYGDPRAQAVLPTLEKGSSRLYAHLDGNKVTWLRLDGSTGSAVLHVPVGAGATEVTVDGATGDATIQHAAGGAAVAVKAASVELGAVTGGTPIALATPITAWAAQVVTALGSLGQTVPALAGVACTKVNGT